MPAKSGASSSSMHTTSSFGSSWISSSPSRQSPSRPSPTRNGARTTPRRDHARRSTLDKDPFESPARQMLLEFSQLLIRSEKELNDRLDLDAAENAKIHNEQLAKAAREHARVREGAELECQRVALEQELERRKREEEQQKEVLRLQQERARKEAEARQRELEAKQREEQAVRQAAEQQRKIQEAEAKIRAQKEEEEAARRQKAAQDEANRKAQEAAAAAAAAQKAQAQIQPQQPTAAQRPAFSNVSAPQSTTTTSVAPASSKPVSPQVEELHAKYLDLHKRMKEFWKPFKKQCAVPGNPLKGPVGDMRRDIRKAMGQVTTKREDSRNVIKKIRDVITSAKQAGGPTLDIRPFLISQQLPQATEAEAQYPQLLLYAYICIEKQVIKQFEQEAANEDGRIIQELGAIVASLLIDKNYIWAGVPMTDLLIAKLHRVCPILFGITGNMNTEAGQARLGWIKIGGEPPEVNTYNQRMLGLGAGYAALSLRHVPQPAIPMSEYWRAVASISNTPSQQLFGGHFMVLKGLIKDHPKKFIGFYGAASVALLRKATVELPARAPPHAKDAANLVRVLPDSWKSTLSLSII